MFQFHDGGVHQRIVMSYHFDVAAIARAFFVNHHHAVGRLLFAAEARQTNHQHALKLLSLHLH